MKFRVAVLRTLQGDMRHCGGAHLRDVCEAPLPHKNTQHPLRFCGMTETYEHAIGGLLQKRLELLTEAERIRDKIAEIRNDILALDRTLGALGYKGELETMMPRQRRQVVFGRGELIRGILDELRGAGRPLRSREIAQALMAVQGNDPRDQRYIADLTRRVGKALRPMRDAGNIASSADQHGNTLWRLT